MGYDIKVLAEKLKAKGLDVAEEAVKILVEETLSWVQEEALKSENKVDDIVAPVISAIKPWVLEQVDKIDKQVG
jgi:hypothetical protein